MAWLRCAFAWCMWCRIFLLCVLYIDCMCKYSVQHTKTKTNETTPAVQHVMYARTRARRIHMLAVCRVRSACCVDFLLCSKAHWFTWSYWCSSWPQAYSLPYLHCILLWPQAYWLTCRYGFFCVCWRGASMFLDSVLKFYFPVSVRIAFACCSVASNMLIGVFTPCDHKHVDWLSHIAFCCGYVTLRIWRGPNPNPAMHPGLQDANHGSDFVTCVNMRNYPTYRRQRGTAYQTECQVRRRSKTKSVFAACRKICLWGPWWWIWWRITTIRNGYARRWWWESRVARKPNTRAMLGCESKSEVLHVRTSTTGHGWHQGASPLSTPTTIISCDFVLLLHYLACD